MHHTDYCKNCSCIGNIIGNGVPNPLLGDGYCNDETNNVHCYYDGLDCCRSSSNTEVCSECSCHDSFTGCDGTGFYWGCCTSSNPCGVSEGHCFNDDDCLGHLLCGTDNCLSPFPSTAGCCYEPFPDCYQASLISDGFCNDDTN